MYKSSKTYKICMLKATQHEKTQQRNNEILP